MKPNESITSFGHITADIVLLQNSIINKNKEIWILSSKTQPFVTISLVQGMPAIPRDRSMICEAEDVHGMTRDERLYQKPSQNKNLKESLIYCFLQMQF